MYCKFTDIVDVLPMMSSLINSIHHLFSNVFSKSPFFSTFIFIFIFGRGMKKKPSTGLERCFFLSEKSKEYNRAPKATTKHRNNNIWYIIIVVIANSFYNLSFIIQIIFFSHLGSTQYHYALNWLGLSIGSIPKNPIKTNHQENHRIKKKDYGSTIMFQLIYKSL